MTVTRRLLILMVLVVSLSPASATAKNIRMTTLYMLEPQYGRVLQPLDPTTLQPSPYMSGIVLGGIKSTPLAYAPPTTMLTSPEGRMLARITNACSGCRAVHGKYITIRVTDLSTGMKLAQFHPRVPMAYFSYLSDDGTTIAGMQNTTTDSHWTTVSTKTGRVVHQFSLPAACCSTVSYDGSTGRLYMTTSTTAHQLEVRVYSGLSGSMLGDLTLPTVMDGSWYQAGEAASYLYSPGIALSGDGTHLAVFDSATQTVTMVDAPALRVTRTLSVAQPTTLADRIGQALGILPTAADAKGPMPNGAQFTARFSHDGHSLFITGRQSGEDAQGNPAWVSTGLQRIDLASGELMGTTLRGTDIQWWAEAGDGSAVYTLSRTTDDQAECPCDLRSNDPSTLQAIAEREFSIAPQLFIIGGGGTI